MSIGEEVVTSTTKYRYLESIIQSNRVIDRNITHSIQAGWLKWRAANGVLCDKKFPSRLKGKFYRVAISQLVVQLRMLACKEDFRTYIG